MSLSEHLQWYVLFLMPVEERWHFYHTVIVETREEAEEVVERMRSAISPSNRIVIAEGVGVFAPYPVKGSG